MSNSVFVRKKFTSRGIANIENANIEKITCNSLYIKNDTTNYADKIQEFFNTQVDFLRYNDIQDTNITNTTFSKQISIVSDSSGSYFEEGKDMSFSVNDKLLLKDLDNNIIPCVVINKVNNIVYIECYKNISGIFNIFNIINTPNLTEYPYTYQISIKTISPDLTYVPIFLPKITKIPSKSSNKQFLITVDKDLQRNIDICLVPNKNEFVNGVNKPFCIRHISKGRNDTYALILVLNDKDEWNII